MARFIIFTEVNDDNDIRGDIAINADHVILVEPLPETVKNAAGEDRPQCRLHLSATVDINYERAGAQTYVDVMGDLISTHGALNYWTHLRGYVPPVQD